MDEERVADKNGSKLMVNSFNALAGAREENSMFSRCESWSDSEVNSERDT